MTYLDGIKNRKPTRVEVVKA